jgi:glycosyltransferase involved in cell wall biosynthesis
MASTVITGLYAEQYPEKVRFLEQDKHQNRGVCASRYLGINHLSGEYIAISDTDEVWLAHKLK